MLGSGKAGADSCSKMNAKFCSPLETKKIRSELIGGIGVQHLLQTPQCAEIILIKEELRNFFMVKMAMSLSLFKKKNKKSLVPQSSYCL